MAKEKIPSVTENSMLVYKDLRQNVRSSLVHGVLPNIIVALNAQLVLTEALTVDSNSLFDEGDRSLLETYHPKSLPAGVRVALNRMVTKMQAVLDEAVAVDTALVVSGKKPYFNVPLPESD